MSRQVSFQIASEHDRLWASGHARRFAADLGFCSLDQARLAVCVAELASNLARHAGGGRLELWELEVPRPGCGVRSEDEGPGIGSFEDALRDGFSEGRWLTPDVPLLSRHGLGVGLGTVCRLLSEVRLAARSGGGLVVEGVLWNGPRAPALSWRSERVRHFERAEDAGDPGPCPGRGVLERDQPGHR
jgi:serine/threonine-protein kinase RsbT